MNGSWSRSVRDIDEEEWTSIFKGEILKSYSLLKAVENSKLESVQHYYFKLNKGAALVGILPCFTFGFNMDILTAGFVKKIIEQVKKPFPNFLKLRIFCVGTPIAICDHLIGIKAQTEKDKKEIFDVMLHEVKRKAKELKCTATIIKEIPAAEDLLLQSLENSGVIIGESLPNSYIFLDERLGDWPEAFRSRYKRRIKSQLKNANKNKEYTWSIVENYDCHSSRFENLYQQVLEKSQYKFEKLNADYFSAVALELPGNSFALTCTDTKGNIVCFELILVKDETIIPLYVGIDYSHLKNGDLYFSCISNLVLIAQEKGYKKIKLGQTSYLAKAYAGAVFEDLKLGIHSHNFLLHSALKTFKKQMFKAPELPEVMVYQDHAIQTLQELIVQNDVMATVVNKTANAV